LAQEKSKSGREKKNSWDQDCQLKRIKGQLRRGETNGGNGTHLIKEGSLQESYVMGQNSGTFALS